MLEPSRFLAAAVIACTLLCVDSAAASLPSLGECFEGADFIADAALSRDAGMSPEAFLGRMRQDFAAIRSYPNELRWFAHDVDDEEFLLAAASEVFAHPLPAVMHREIFLRACIDRMAG